MRLAAVVAAFVLAAPHAEGAAADSNQPVAPKPAAAAPPAGCVVVTGASGWVASNVVEVLLQQGRTVHGTVRDPAKKSNDHLRALATKYAAKGGSLKLFKADLHDPHAFDEAAVGCSGFQHIALSFDDMSKSNVEATRNALESARKAGVSSFVLTSSVSAAITSAKVSTPSAQCKALIDENDWVETESPSFDEYGFTKKLQERVAHTFLAEFPTPPFRFSAILFPFAVGPLGLPEVQSSQFVAAIPLMGILPFSLPIHLDVSSVRDVARAHVHVMDHPKASRRYIVARPNSCRSFTDIAALYKKDAELSARYVRLPIFELPYAVIRALSLLLPGSAKSNFFYGLHRCNCGYDGTRIERELGFKYEHRDVDAYLLEAARSIASADVIPAQKYEWSVVLPVVGVIALVATYIAFVCVRCVCRRMCCGGSAGNRQKGKAAKRD